MSEILNLISKLAIKKACGYDQIFNKILKAASYVVAPFLTTLSNKCMHQGVFLIAYKIAKIIPLLKKEMIEKSAARIGQSH